MNDKRNLSLVAHNAASRIKNRRWTSLARSAPLQSILAATLVAAVPAASLAQPAPPSRDELVPPQVRPDARERTNLTIDGGLTRTPCALDNADLDGISVTLSQVNFVGAEGASDVDLQAASAPFVGREVPLSTLCDIRAVATQMLSDAGYLAAVEIPEQRLDGGVAELRVVLGRLTALRVRGDAGRSEDVLAGYLQRLVGQEVFNIHTAERYLLLADDIPGLDVRLALRPAANGQPGDLIGEVAVLRRRVSIDANVQNYGSPALGRFGGLIRAELYDLTGMGDRTTISFFSSHDFNEQQTLQFGHDFLVGSDGLSFGGQLTLGWTHPTLDLPGFDIASDTVFARVSARYPLRRTQAQTIYASTGLDVVDQNVDANRINLSRDRVRTAWMRFDFTQTDADSVARRNGYTPYEPRGRVGVSVELRQGLDILGANLDCRTVPANCIAAGELPSRIEQDPTPMLVRAEIHGEYRPTPVITFAYDVEAQYTRDPLSSFEEITGGNYSIGRGYDPGAINGDTGYAAAMELRYGSLIPKTTNSFALQPYVFADYATVRDRDPSQRALNPDGLLSVGGGLRFTHGRGVQGDVTLAIPLERTDSQELNSQRRGDIRLLFSLTSRLMPWRF